MDDRIRELFEQAAIVRIKSHPKYQFCGSFLKFFKPLDWFGQRSHVTFKRAKSISGVAKELSIDQVTLEKLFSSNLFWKKTTQSGMIKQLITCREIEGSYTVTHMTGVYAGEIRVHIDGKFKESHHPGGGQNARMWCDSRLRREAFNRKKIFVSNRPTEDELIQLMLVSIGELDLNTHLSHNPTVAFSFSTEWTNKYLILKQEIDSAKNNEEIEKLSKELDEARSRTEILQKCSYGGYSRNERSDEDEQLFAAAVSRYHDRYYASGEHDSSGGWPGNSY